MNFNPSPVSTAARPITSRDSYSHAGTSTIQIIEDDAPLGTALAAGLEAHGFRTFYSPNAATGLEQAHQRPPDLILCDINMPGVNGHRLLAELRTDPQLADCQFVFMTGNTRYAQPRDGMELGADDFLLKPFSLDTLVACITARLQRAELSRKSEAALLRELRASLRTTLPHEFFTPLTGIIGYSELLLDEAATLPVTETKSIVEDILRSGHRLHRTLRNYLAVLGLEPGGSNPPQNTLSDATVRELLMRAATSSAQRHKRVADLQLDVTGATVCCTPTDLSAVLEELADNAFSYSSPGSQVQVRVQPAGSRLRLSVTDTGRGMSEHQMKHLAAFHQFERKKFEQQGLGLGLTVVQKALRRMEGELQFSSTPGQGTTAVVSLPIAGPPKYTENPPA